MTDPELNAIRLKLTHGFEIDWSKTLSNWAAMDKNGRWYGYSKEPHMDGHEDEWLPKPFFYDEGPRYVRLHWLPALHGEPASGTLLRRPEP